MPSEISTTGLVLWAAALVVGAVVIAATAWLLERFVSSVEAIQRAAGSLPQAASTLGGAPVTTALADVAEQLDALEQGLAEVERPAATGRQP